MEANLVRNFRCEKGQEFKLEFSCKRKQSLGPVEVDHWWMPITPLYGQRDAKKSSCQNHTEILRMYWREVEAKRATQVRDAQERFLQASIVPDVRAQGSRTIFADAFLSRSNPEEKDQGILDLEKILHSSRDHRISRENFEKGCWKLLGRSEFPAETQQIYDELNAKLMDKPCAQLGRGEIKRAKETVRQNWNDLMRTIGRRANKQTEKIALDAISYEARAAFHHCYSVAWLLLLFGLKHTDSLSPQSETFLKFWHTAAPDPNTPRLFHGHVFGLHPATGLFIQTPTGQTLLGNWISAPDSDETFERLLNGLLLALFDYDNRRQSAAESRRRRNEVTVDDIEAVQKIVVPDEVEFDDEL